MPAAPAAAGSVAASGAAVVSGGVDVEVDDVVDAVEAVGSVVVAATGAVVVVGSLASEPEHAALAAATTTTAMTQRITCRVRLSPDNVRAGSVTQTPVAGGAPRAIQNLLISL